jgi:hypothetical protein
MKFCVIGTDKQKNLVLAMHLLQSFGVKWNVLSSFKNSRDKWDKIADVRCVEARKLSSQGLLPERGLLIEGTDKMTKTLCMNASVVTHLSTDLPLIIVCNSIDPVSVKIVENLQAVFVSSCKGERLEKELWNICPCKQSVTETDFKLNLSKIGKSSYVYMGELLSELRTFENKEIEEEVEMEKVINSISFKDNDNAWYFGFVHPKNQKSEFIHQKLVKFCRGMVISTLVTSPDEIEFQIHDDSRCSIKLPFKPGKGDSLILLLLQFCKLLHKNKECTSWAITSPEN